MRFIDEVRITVKSGNGGNGCAAFRREKYVPRGGPSGGDGGNGGDVVLRADERVGTLLEYKYAPLIRAGKGQHGKGSDKCGEGGASKEIPVPVGTIVFDDNSGDLLADLNHRDAAFVAARGGRGGRGNLRFKSSVNRTPNYAEEGKKGETRDLRLELKLLADVGIIGLPNVGKSTLISRLSAARPKIADYPFTTLVPSLGVVRVEHDRSFVLADIPGLVPGAAQGAGLGNRFLRHVERTRALLHLVCLRPGEICDPLSDFETINKELANHDPKLASRPQIVACNKADLTETQEIYPNLKKRFAERGCVLHLISAVSGKGLDKLIWSLWNLANSEKDPDIITCHIHDPVKA